MEFLKNITFVDIIAVLSSIVMVARIIVKLTPSDLDNVWLEKIVIFLSHLGLQLGVSEKKVDQKIEKEVDFKVEEKIDSSKMENKIESEVEYQIDQKTAAELNKS